MATRPRILLIDDEAEFADFLQRGLTYEGYSVGIVYTAQTGRQSILANRPDLVLLDVMLPDLDGMTFCRQLRQAGQQTPILMLTARDGVSDRIAGLNAGADDYLPKPFAFDELLARIRALLRRFGEEDPAQLLQFADVTLVLAQRLVKRGDRLCRLTAKEFELLEFLFHHPHQVLPRSLLMDRIWGYDSEVESNVLDVYIRQLRKKLGEPDLIDTVRHIGYALRTPRR
ncbi:MAG: response regulator transcription factor [Caldilineaceae bacterium]|nr:response regulator transcription factor [Caldilineaceae bacterium]